MRHVAQVVAVDRDGARLRVVEAREQLDDRRLAGAGVADERHGLAGLRDQVEPVQHPRPGRSRSGRPRSATSPAIGGSVDGVRAVDDVRLESITPKIFSSAADAPRNVL